MTTVPMALRPAVVGDVPFIARSWLKSARGSFAVPDSAYFPVHSPIVNRLLHTHGATVACDPDDPNVIYGFACGTPDVLFYVYTKHAFRRFGIAAALVGATSPGAKRCGYLTNRCRGLAAKHGISLDPYAVAE